MAIILALAVLFSQGGGSVLAAICPHLRSLHNASCHEIAQVVSAGDHAMRHDSDEPVFETEDAAISCNHCAVHSRTKPDDSALPQLDTFQRANDLVTPIAATFIAPSLPSRTIAWTANAHGPPGAAGPLHLLLNVFRI